MKLPQGMNKDEVDNIIISICEKFKYKYTIDIYDEDDMMQEAFIICYEALERYDGVRPLQNFLSFNLRNRLLNHIRDIKLKHINSSSISDDFDMEELEKKRLIVDIDSLMDESLDPETRQDWLRLKDGVKVPVVRTNKLKGKIKELYQDIEEKD